MEKQEKILTQLLDLCADTKNFYQKACEQLENNHIKSVFNNAVDLHSTIISEFKSFSAIRETEIEASISISGKTAQIAGQIKAAVQNNDQTLVTELINMETKLIEEFEAALDQRIEQQAISLIGKQLMRLKQNYDNLQKLNYYLEKQ